MFQLISHKLIFIFFQFNDGYNGISRILTIINKLQTYHLLQKYWGGTHRKHFPKWLLMLLLLLFGNFAVVVVVLFYSGFYFYFRLVQMVICVYEPSDNNDCEQINIVHRVVEHSCTHCIYSQFIAMRFWFRHGIICVWVYVHVNKRLRTGFDRNNHKQRKYGEREKERAGINMCRESWILLLTLEYNVINENNFYIRKDLKGVQPEPNRIYKQCTFFLYTAPFLSIYETNATIRIHIYHMHWPLTLQKYIYIF